MLYDLTNESTLMNIIDIVESAENMDRIEKNTSDYVIINGNQHRKVLNSLQAKYPESWQSMTVVNLKIGKKIIRKLSRCYSNGVKREVVDKKTGDVHKELTELMGYIYDDIDENGRDFNTIMARANELYSNHRYVEVFVYVDEEDGKIRFKPLPQQLFTAMPNKTKTKSEVIVFRQEVSTFEDPRDFIDWDELNLERENSEIIGVYTLWSKESHFDFVRIKSTEKAEDDEDRIVFRAAIVKDDGNLDQKNPYNVHTFAQIKEDTDGHFYPDSSEIAEMSKEINVVLSDLVSVAAQQGFGQAVIYFDGEKPPAVTKSGPTHVINIPNRNGKSKFEFANANPDLKGHLDIALALTRMLLTTNDLTTDKVSGELSATNFASGIDRLIADSETVENIEDQRKKYITAERNIFNIVIKILLYLFKTNDWPDDYPKVNVTDLDIKKYRLKVTFNDIKPLTTEKSKAETISFLEEKGFIKSHEKHMRFDGTLTEPQAIKREQEIQEEKNKKKEAFFKEQRDKINQKDDDGSQENQKSQFSQLSEGRQGYVGESGDIDGKRQEEVGKRSNQADKRKNAIRNRSRQQRKGISA